MPSAARAGTQTSVESRKLDLMTPTPNGSGVGDGDGTVVPGWTGSATSQATAWEAARAIVIGPAQARRSRPPTARRPIGRTGEPAPAPAGREPAGCGRKPPGRGRG